MSRGRAMRGPSKAAFLAVLLVAGPFVPVAQAFAQGGTQSRNCPEGYEKLCAGLVKPPANGGIGSAAGTGSKSTGHIHSYILENRDFKVKGLGSESR
jgi:hypothetical protein